MDTLTFRMLTLLALSIGNPPAARAAEDQVRRPSAAETAKLDALLAAGEEVIAKSGDAKRTAKDVLGSGAEHVPYVKGGRFTIGQVAAFARAVHKKGGVFVGKLPPGTLGKPATTRSGKGIVLSEQLITDLCGADKPKALCAKVNTIVTLYNEVIHLLQNPPSPTPKRIECDMERDSDLLSALVARAFVTALQQPGSSDTVARVDPMKCPKLAACLTAAGLANDAATARKLRDKFKRWDAGLRNRIAMIFTPEIDETGPNADNDWSRAYYGGAKDSRRTPSGGPGGGKRFIDPFDPERSAVLHPPEGHRVIRTVTAELAGGAEIFHLLSIGDSGGAMALRTFLDEDGDGLPEPRPVSEVYAPAEIGPRAPHDVQLHLFFPGDAPDARTGIVLIDAVTGDIWSTAADPTSLPLSDFTHAGTDPRITAEGGGFRFPAGASPADPQTGLPAMLVLTSTAPVLHAAEAPAIALSFFGPAPGEAVPGGSAPLSELDAAFPAELPLLDDITPASGLPPTLDVRRSPGAVQIEILGRPGSRYDVHHSRDLLQWTEVATDQPGDASLLDPSPQRAAAGSGYYRAVERGE